MLQYVRAYVELETAVREMHVRVCPNLRAIETCDAAHVSVLRVKHVDMSQA